jgi:hypothetical protein
MLGYCAEKEVTDSFLIRSGLLQFQDQLSQGEWELLIVNQKKGRALHAQGEFSLSQRQLHDAYTQGPSPQG